MKYRYNLLLLVFLFCISHFSAKAQVYLGYSDNEIANGIALGQNVTSSAAIYISEDIASMYKGNKAVSVRVGLINEVSYIKVFITKDLNGTPLSEAEFSDQKEGMISFNLDTPVELDGEAFYVGYTCTGTGAIGRSNVYNDNGCWLKESEDSEWVDFATNENYKYNALNLSVRIEGSSFPFDARLIAHKEFLVGPDEEFDLDVKLENMSKTAIRKYQLKYSVDGGEENLLEKSVYLQSGASTKISVPMPGFSEVGKYKVTFTLLTVNGEADDFEGNNTVETVVNVSGVSFVKRMVVEEKTGTWCGWCPRGIVGFRVMEEKYHDRFIGIAVHGNNGGAIDPMTVSSYIDKLLVNSGFPKCIVNRNPSTVMDPTAGNLETMYGKVASEKAIVAVSVDAELDNSSKKINAKASLQFVADEVNADYKLAFVVLEDSVTGYSQANNYSGGATEMGGFEDLPEYVSISMNHVARGIYDYEGLEGSVPSDIKAGVTYDYEKQIDLPKIQKTSHLYIVAMVINGKSGMIENAAKSKIKVGTGLSYEENSDVRIWINENGTVVCSEDEGTIEVFDMNGMRISNKGLARGLYIVKYTDSASNTVVEKLVY